MSIAFVIAFVAFVACWFFTGLLVGACLRHSDRRELRERLANAEEERNDWQRRYALLAESLRMRDSGDAWKYDNKTASPEYFD